MENFTSHTHRISNKGNVFTDVTLAYDDDTRFNAHNLISVSVMVISVGSGQYYLHSQEQLSERVFSSVSTGIRSIDLNLRKDDEFCGLWLDYACGVHLSPS